MESRAYSLLEIRAVDDETWVIEGVASTPTPDRYGDIVEPMGAQFSLPMPLLWQHNASKPVGHVTFAKATKSGIPFKAKILKASDFTSQTLQDRALEAWESVKTGLVRAVSIGFRSIEHSYMSDGGIHFLAWEWVELSLVTIPANAEATISTIKSIDAGVRAASGRTLPVRLPAHASGTTTTKSIDPKPRGGTMRKSIPEMVATLEATIEVKRGRQLELSSKAAEEGRTKDAAEQEEFNTLLGEVEALEKELGDWQKMQRSAQAAKPVDTQPTSQAGTQSRSTIVRTEQRAEPGIRFARVVKSLWQSRQRMQPIEAVARALYPDDHLTHKAAVAAASTTGDTWGSQLVGDETTVFADFVEFLRPQTILGKFGANGIPSLRSIPFRTPLISQTGGGAGYWVGEGKPKPLTSLAFARTTIEPLKVANIAVATKELLRSSSPAADGLIRDSLASALRERLDTDFIDPTNAGSTGVKPAAITNGATTYTASGTGDADDVRLDVRSIFQGFIDADNAPTTGVWIMSSSLALALSVMVNALGQPEFAGLGMGGGTFFGLPVITSEYVPAGYVVLVNAGDVYLGDEGGIMVDVSTEASLEMKDQDVSTGVTNNSTSPTAASLVSLWQTNSVGFLAEREINWSLRRASAVQVLASVAWGGAVTAADS